MELCVLCAIGRKGSCSSARTAQEPLSSHECDGQHRDFLDPFASADVVTNSSVVHDLCTGQSPKCSPTGRGEGVLGALSPPCPAPALGFMQHPVRRVCVVPVPPERYCLSFGTSTPYVCRARPYPVPSASNSGGLLAWLEVSDRSSPTLHALVHPFCVRRRSTQPIPSEAPF